MYRNKGDDVIIPKLIGYHFKNKKLLLQALTRRSALNERRQNSDIGDFQRLEFIGDRVINLVISEILFDNHPDLNEGQLTIELNKFTNNSRPLAEVAKSLKLGEFLILGLGEENLNLRENVKVLTDAFEALIGAIWIDSNNDYAFIKRLVRKHFKKLGLIDFNEERKEQQKMAEIFNSSYKSIMKIALPELYEFGGGSEVSVTREELAQHIRKLAKPLSELTLSSRRSVYDSDDESDEYESDEYDAEAVQNNIKNRFL